MSDLQTEPPAARPRRWTRWLRRGVWAVTGPVVLALALVPLVPLVVRGRILRGVAARMTASLCGSLTFGDGRLGWGVVPDLLLGRPAPVTLERLRIMAPDGRVALSAERLTAEVQLLRRPWRVVIPDALMETGGWELVAPPSGGPAGLVDAFRSVSGRASREACLARPAPAAAAAHAPAEAPPFLDIRHLRLHAVDVGLGFPLWGLTLARVDVEGSLSIGRTKLLFDARDAVARGGGLLRVGRDGDASSARARFDEVDIARVAVLPAAPADLALELTQATTGRSRLTGRAVFRNVFPAAGRPRTAARPAPEIDLDAHWTQIGDALSALEASWLSAGLRHLRLDGGIEATLHGPFTALAGQIRAAAGPVRLEARLDEHGRLDTDLRVDDADTAVLLPAALRTPLGGRLSGRLGVRARLAPRLEGLMVELREADLRLDRTWPGRWPPHLTLRLEPPPGAPGPPVETPAPKRAAVAGDRQATLSVTLARARLDHATLQLDDLRAGWPSLRVRGALVVRLASDGRAGAAPSPSPSPTSPPSSSSSSSSSAAAPAVLTAHLDVAAPSLARLLPGSPLRGAIEVKAVLSGSADRLLAQVSFTPPRTVWAWDQSFTLNPSLTASLLQGSVVAISGAGFTHAGGGVVSASGRMVSGGAVEAKLRVRGYPAGQLPGLERVELPAALRAGARRLTLRQALRGLLDGDVQLGGTLALPTASATVQVAGLRLGDRSLGDGALRIRTRGDGLTFDGSLGPALTFDGTARAPGALERGRAGAISLSATVTARLHDLRLGAWLPAPWDALAPAASGELVGSVGSRTGEPPALRGSLRLESLAGALQLDGSTDGARAGGRLRGRLQLERLRALWSPWLADARGAIDLDLTVADGTLALPSLLERTVGQLQLAGELALRPAGWPEPVTVAEGGRIELDGRRWRTPGLALAAPRAGIRGRVAGEVRVDGQAPLRTELALSVAGQVDAALLAARRPDLGTASGRLDVDARLTGTLDQPVVEGGARVDVSLRPAARALPPLRATGSIQARDQTLSTRDLRVAIEGVGLLTVGSGDQPATARLVSAWPPALGPIDLPLAGHHLTFDRQAVPISFDSLDLALRLEGRADGQLLLRGLIDLGRAKYDRRRGAAAPAKKAAPSRWYRSLPPWLTLDLTLRGPDHALTVAIPFLPDVTLDFDCHLIASARGASISGSLRGAAPYSRAALAIYDWTKKESVRQCQIFPQ